MADSKEDNAFPLSIQSKLNPYGNFVWTLTPETTLDEVEQAVGSLTAACKANAVHVRYTLPHGAMGLDNVLHSAGFKFHSAFNNQWEWFKWLNPKEPCKIPTAAVAIMGVSAVVRSDNNLFLMIQEHSRGEDGKYHIRFDGKFKCVSGAVDLQETPVDTVARELKEECGIPADMLDLKQPTFLSGYMERNARPGGVCDVFLCLLVPLKGHVDADGMIHPTGGNNRMRFKCRFQPDEVAQGKWFTKDQLEEMVAKGAAMSSLKRALPRLNANNGMKMQSEEEGTWNF